METDLFPDANQYHRESLPGYIRQQLVELAKANKLCLTEVMAQPKRVANEAGMVILGQSWEHQHDELLGSGAKPVPDPAGPPEELAQYQVKLKVINAAAEEKTIRVKLPKRLVGYRNSPNAAQLGLNGDQRLAVYEDDYREFKVTRGQATLPAPIAWHALKQAGARCCRAKRAEHQAKAWRYEEVRP